MKFLECRLVDAVRLYKLTNDKKEIKYSPSIEKGWNSAGVYYLQNGIYIREEEFLRTHMPIIDNKIREENIEDMIYKTDTSTVDDRTTLVRAELTNGFVMFESSSCVDPKNYNQKIGEEICLHHIREQIWKFLGFVLASANGGIGIK